MLETLEWIHKFKNHEAFKRIKSTVSENTDSNVSRNILAYRHGDVFMWDETSLSILSFQLKNFLADPQKEFCQELTWINPPRFGVDHLLLAAPTSNSLALYGSGGVQVLQMPRVKVTRENSISCICSSIDEHFFITSGHKLIHLNFHPGFSSPDVLFILTSNNFIRIYSTDQHQEPLTFINLQPLSPTPLSSKSLLGDTFVSFDFSEMLEMKTKNPSTHQSTTQSFNQSINQSINQSANHLTTSTNPSTTSVPAWHVFFLMSNGQVFYATVVFDGVNTFRHILHGCMRMYPAADDNYGLDACSLLHLPTTPPLLIIATQDGHLHHSLILNPEAANCYDDDDDGAGDDSITGGGRNQGGNVSHSGGGNVDRRGGRDRSFKGSGGGRGDGEDYGSDVDDSSFLKAIRNMSSSFNTSGRALCIDNRGINSNPDNKKALYVYQTVQLELQLSTPSLTNAESNVVGGDNGGGNGGVGAFYNYPIVLQRDASNKYRYHCRQPCGLHSIMPLWLNSIEKFFGADNEDEPWQYDDNTIVEHVICTSPLACPQSPKLIGVTQLNDPFLGSHLITLTSQYTLTIIPYLQSHKLETHPLKIESPFNHPYSSRSEDFVAKVTRMLIKDTNNPIMSGPLDANLKAEECFSLLCRSTQVFRTEYIAKYDLVRVELDKNICRLEKVKQRQIAEQVRLAGGMDEYRHVQEALINKLNSVLEKQADLCSRLNRLTHDAEKGISFLSDAENSALTRLKQLDKIVQKHSQSLSLLKKKCSYNGEVISNTHQKKDALYLTPEKSHSVKKLLKNEGEEIANLIKTLKRAQISVGM